MPPRTSTTIKGNIQVLEELKGQFREEIAAIEYEKKVLQAEHKGLGEVRKWAQQIQTEVQQAQEEARRAQAEARRAQAEARRAQAEAERTQEEAERTQEEAEGAARDTLEVRKEVDATREEIEGYHTYVYGNMADEEEGGGEKIPGKKEEIDQFFKKQVKIFFAFGTKIQDLLPGATAAGLSASYTETSNAHQTGMLCYMGLFCAAVLAILGTLFHFNFSSFENAGSSLDILNRFLKTLPFISPLVWLAVVAQKNAAIYRRLNQEYLHKANVTKTFDGLRNAIEAEAEGSGKKLVGKLLAMMVHMVAFNPSGTIEKTKEESLPEKAYKGASKAQTHQSTLLPK